MPSVPDTGTRSRRARRPRGPERKRFCASCDHPVGRCHGPRRPDRGLLPPLRRPPTPSPRSCGRVTSSAASTWSPGASPTAGWDGSTWRRTRTSKTAGSSSRVSSTRRRVGDGRGHRRATVPGRGRPPQHRQDHNFVEHDGAGYIVMEYVGGESLRELRNRHREERCSAAGGPGDRVHPRDPPCPRLSPPARSPLLRLQAGQRHPDRGAAHAHRPGRSAAHGRRRQRPLRHDRLPGARGARTRGSIRDLGSLHRGAHAGRPEHRIRRLPGREALRHAAPAARGRPGIPALRVLPRFLEKATAADPSRDSSRPAKWRSSSSACCARSCAVDGGSRRPAPSARFSAELGASRTAARGSSFRSPPSTPPTRRPASWPPWPSRAGPAAGLARDDARGRPS